MQPSRNLLKTAVMKKLKSSIEKFMMRYFLCSLKARFVKVLFQSTVLVVIFVLAVFFNPLSANPTKWSNTRLSVFNYFVGLVLKGFRIINVVMKEYTKAEGF